jgi:hypothetical protein
VDRRFVKYISDLSQVVAVAIADSKSRDLSEFFSRK